MRRPHFLVTFVTPREWERYFSGQSWWFGFCCERDWLYYRIAGLEVSVT